jgi:predicted lipoprotein
VRAKAAQLLVDWKATGDRGAAEQFVKAGQESVNLLVNQLTLGIENIGDRHLNFVLLLPQPVSAQLDRIERSRSGTSLEGVLASLESARRLYGVGDRLGLDDAVKRLNAPAERRVEEQFEAAIAAVRAIGMPLEQAVADNRAAIQTAYDKTHALEILFKVDVASTLGVTLTFSSADGD